ncbi:transposase [Bacillus thuringiensis]|uniref:IS6 family transposase n=1 Tax=Bacillus thuringiensis TaxID=1428 RepID=A0A437SB02_BACTU|nr:DDE-type integrase/transposase/recombinase [Bacillus thuringiensis]MBG9541067.1 transposase [Bacillus thuringiensis]MBG9585316.1 transposase [Bacillus thuringiensis]RVU60234.1 IS6 family transposase [Bacillus thuringiensis]
MEQENIFKWKHYQPDIILLTVRWYLRYNLSLRDLVEMMEERGLSLAHTTIMRWAHQYGPELNKRIRKHLKPTIDSEGNTIDFYLSQKRDAKEAKCFLKKALASCHVTKPRSITADGDKAYPVAIRELKEEKCIPHGTPLRMKKYLNNIIEQDHRFIKKRIRNMLGLKSVLTATKMIAGIEVMHMIKKGQTLQGKKSVQKQIYLIHELFGLTA